MHASPSAESYENMGGPSPMISGTSTEAPSSATNLSVINVDAGRKLTNVNLAELEDLSPHNRKKGMGLQSSSLASLDVA